MSLIRLYERKQVQATPMAPYMAVSEFAYNSKHCSEYSTRLDTLAKLAYKVCMTDVIEAGGKIVNNPYQASNPLRLRWF